MYDRLTEVENIYAEPFAAENYLFFAGAQAYPLAVIFEHAVESVYARLAPAENSTCTCEYFSTSRARLSFYHVRRRAHLPALPAFWHVHPSFPNNVCSPGNKRTQGEYQYG